MGRRGESSRNHRGVSVAVEAATIGLTAQPQSIAAMLYLIRRSVLPALIALSLGACATLSARDIISVKLAAINDFHGYVQASAEPVVASNAGAAPARTLAGGAAKLAAIVDTLRAQNPHFAFVSSGDLIGASPLISAAFDDEPTIDVMNAAGLDFNAVGNHEFDGGLGHLRRLQAGGCPSAGCKSGTAFNGARFGLLAANVIVQSTGKPLFPPYGIKTFGGVKVAFIGVTLKGTPEISSARNVAGLEFRDEAEVVNALVPELKRQGIEAIVVLIHQGGITRGGPNECVDLRGPLRDIVERFDRAVDLVLSGHTHQAYVCELDGRLVTSAGSYGRFITEVDLRIDPQSRDIVSARAVNRAVTPDTPDNERVAALTAHYVQLAAPLQRIVGRLAAPITRRPNRDGESDLGQLIADAHLAATRDAGAVAAFVNPGGIRAPLESNGEGEITYSQVFDVYPFNNTLVTMTLTGAQLVALLEQQWQQDFARVLQVSSGFSYVWNAGAPPGSRIARETVMIDGRPLRLTASYRVAVNSYLADGGDRFTVLLEGTGRTPGVSSREAIVRYLEAHSPLAPGSERRIRRVEAR